MPEPSSPPHRRAGLPERGGDEPAQLRRRLEEADLPGETIARACGFGNGDGMRRAFQRRLGVAPREYRERFRPMAAPDIMEERA